VDYISVEDSLASTSFTQLALNTKTSLYHIIQCKVYFDIMNRLGATQECDRKTNERTDGQTGIPSANAALHYVSRPKQLKRDKRHV